MAQDPDFYAEQAAACAASAAAATLANERDKFLQAEAAWQALADAAVKRSEDAARRDAEREAMAGQPAEAE